MTSSAKKKKEKKKDFQKAKLKVGKAKPKAANFTDTSFKSKAIVLAEQSIKSEAPSSTSQFDHHVSLLSSRSDSQRRESLSYLTTAVSVWPTNDPLPLGTLLPKLLPLIQDGSPGVRNQLLKLLQVLPKGNLDYYAEQVMLYIRAGMTHLAVDIRRSTLDIFDWAMGVCGRELLESPGGWIKTLKTFLILLGWSSGEKSSTKWSSNAVSVSGNERIMSKALATLASFLELGLIESETSSYDEAQLAWEWFPLRHTWLHMMPTTSHAYRRLNLFGAPRDEEGEVYGDVDARRESFRTYQGAFEKGVEGTRKAGGELGRAGGKVAKVISEGMKGIIDDDEVSP